MSDGPNFLCIGAEKAGTTWLYDNLRHHPEIWLPPPPFKELHYFDDRVPNRKLLQFGRFDHGSIFRRYSPILRSPTRETARWLWNFNHHHSDSMHWYRSLFSMTDKTCGDITPAYSTLDERGVEYARAVVGDRCRIILILRDPVARSWSAVKMLYRYKGINIEEADVSSIINNMQFTYNVLSSGYTRIINTWRKYFDIESFKILYFDDLKSDNATFLKDVCHYIGVNSGGWSPPKLNISSNKDRKRIEMPPALLSSFSQFYLPELEELSQMIGGHSVSWLRKAETAARNNVTR